MRIAFAGSTGFIGTRAAAALKARGDEVLPLRRNLVTWAGEIDGADAVVNLAGESVAGGRWTAARKEALRESRLKTTRAAVDAIARAARKPRVLVNASAVGYYGDTGDSEIREDAPRGSGFLADLCREWEAEARRAEASGVRVVLLRFGVILGPGGGALPRMALPFKLFAGGPLGSGRQWLPWADLDDAAGAVLFALDTPALAGPVNVAAPQAVTNAQFSKELGRALHRPSWAPAPAFALRLALGEMADMLLGGQRVVPAALLKSGYRFKQPKVADSLAQILKT